MEIFDLMTMRFQFALCQEPEEKTFTSYNPPKWHLSFLNTPSLLFALFVDVQGFM